MITTWPVVCCRLNARYRCSLVLYRKPTFMKRKSVMGFPQRCGTIPMDYFRLCLTGLFFSWYHSAQLNSTFLTHRNKYEKSAQRLRKHCALAVVRRSQKFRPTADPLPGGAGRPKFNQLEMVTTFTCKPSSVRFDSRNFELSW